MVPLYFPKLIQIIYELMLGIKWLWLMPNLTQILSIYLKVHAEKQSGPVFGPALYIRSEFGGVVHKGLHRRASLQHFRWIKMVQHWYMLGCERRLTSKPHKRCKLDEKKRSERRKHCARAGCSKVRTPPVRPPARCHKPTDRTDYNTLRRS